MQILPSTWAEENRELPEGSALPGRFSFYMTPYLREILDSCADRRVSRVVCRKSSQIGWTDGVMVNLIAWRIAVNPGRIVIMFARTKSAIDFNDEKLEPTIAACPALSAKVQLKSRAAGNRQLFKRFAGGFLKLIASNAPGDVKSTSAPLVCVEEPDDCNINVKGQGDSIKLAEDRSKTFHNALLIIGGTPTVKGSSAIDFEIAKTDRRKFHVPCHHCGTAHVLAWENVQWDKDPDHPHAIYGKHHPQTARYVCPTCDGTWNDAERARNVRQGQWIATAAFSGARGYDDINELYSLFPGSTLAKVTAKYLDAHREFAAGRSEKMIAFWNGSLGRSFEYSTDLPKTADMESRAEDYAEGTVPAEGLALVMGADVQHDRLALEIWAFGRDGESWLIYWGEEYGITANPADPVWAALDAHVDKAYPHAGGGECRIEAVSIDSSDGQTSDAVYGWVRKRKYGRAKVMAVKGRSTGTAEIFSMPPDKSIDPGYTSKASRHGVKVFMVGTERAKDLILGFTAEGGRIKRCDRAADGTVATGRGPGRVHWYRGVRADFYEQLVDSEVKIPSARAGGKLTWTLKTGKRNEALDCAVYAEHASRALRLHLYTESAWKARADALGRTNAESQDLSKVGKEPLMTVSGGFFPIAAKIRNASLDQDE